MEETGEELFMISRRHSSPQGRSAGSVSPGAGTHTYSHGTRVTGAFVLALRGRHPRPERPRA